MNDSKTSCLQITALEGIQDGSKENYVVGDEDDRSKEDSVGAMLSLLSMCIKGVRRETLQLKFSTICETLTRHLAVYHNSENNTILKSVLNFSINFAYPIQWIFNY